MNAEPTDPLPGWERLRHAGLLFDKTRLEELAKFVPTRLYDYKSQKLRQFANAILDGTGKSSTFVAFVLQVICGLDGTVGRWERGSNVPASLNRRAVTGEMVKPNHIWIGQNGGLIPIFIDDSKQLGIGRGRRAVSRTVGWLRAGNHALALLTNGKQWRLLFAGLDFEAWCEWDVDRWFEQGEISPQVTAFRTLIQAKLWEPIQGNEPLLVKAIRDSRKGQADLSVSLGERVRQAVEILIQGHGDALKELTDSVESADIYRAACRIAMRLVVILFAEARNLLPHDNSLYYESYGLNGLMEQLERRSGHQQALATSYSAWPRVLALFKLVHDGSHHSALPINAYGGGLLAPSSQDSDEGIARALSVFEEACFTSETLPDLDVHRILRCLTRTTMRIRQGRSTKPVKVPIDFLELSSEYIGLLYEGLLDYELKIASSDDPVVFIAVGEQPALPLSTMEAMTDSALRILFEKLEKNSRQARDDPAGDGSSESTEPESPPAPLEPDTAELADEQVVAISDARLIHHRRAEQWARRAALIAGLVKRPRGRQTLEQKAALERELVAEARQLIVRVVLPGEWYLVRWGGTRKGSGSFYTRPALAVPTVQRTLRPLAYETPMRQNGTPNRNASLTEWLPKTPEQILALTICDPACGSGTFPLAALRFLTDALYASLQYHGRISRSGEVSTIRLLYNSESSSQADGSLTDELIPCPPDSEDFEPRLKALLRRHVVERCIYAIDLDPLAVELCRLSLWIETMDRNLPFGFIDHKIKCGNALIGTWFDQFQHYPVMAWKNRKLGDESHKNGVHHQQEEWTNSIKTFISNRLKPDLDKFFQGETLFEADLLKKTTEVHKDALDTLSAIHSLPLRETSEREQMYRIRFLGSKAWNSLKDSMDLWCACWFWPATDSELENAPLPSTITEPADQTRSIAKSLATKLRFFHWELEFPDVFDGLGSGFDAVLGNPPWDIAKPKSDEFFSNLDPLYKSYHNQQAMARQSDLFQDPLVERQWLNYKSRFRAQSNFVRCVANPFGDPEDSEKSMLRFTLSRSSVKNLDLHTRWRTERSHIRGFSDPSHPYRHQGGADLNLYKLFLEVAHAILGCPTKLEGNDVEGGGRLGFIVPSGIYSDRATKKLRDLFAEHCRWEWLFGIMNQKKIFPIDSRQKFCSIILQKGGSTEAIETVFMRENLADWERAESISISYEIGQVTKFSPTTHSILEIQSEKDLAILDKVYSNGILLGTNSAESWRVRYVREFDSSGESKIFMPRPEWDNRGYRPDEYSRWLSGNWRSVELLRFDTLGSVDRPISEDSDAHVELNTSTVWHQSCSDHSPQETLLGLDTYARPNKRGVLLSQQHSGQLISQSSPPPPPRLRHGLILSRDGRCYISEQEINGVALPFYEGRMIGQYDFSQKGWIRGRGRSAVWDGIPWSHKVIDPQFLMGEDVFSGRTTTNHVFKLAHMRVTSATNTRTAIGSLIPSMPAGDKAPLLCSSSLPQILVLCSVFNSLSFDFLTRLRLIGLHLDYHVLEQSVLPNIRRSAAYRAIVELSARLSFVDQLFSGDLIRICKGNYASDLKPCLTSAERLRATVVIDAIVAVSYSLTLDELVYILRDCDYPVEQIRTKGFTSDLDPKGFWRIDKHRHPELRQTILTVVAFCDLCAMICDAGGDREKGIELFVSQNDGEGWMLPEYLRLSDYGLGRDDRASGPQPVAGVLGPRHYDWQLVQTADEIWRERHIHARNMLGEVGYARLIADIAAARTFEGEECSEHLVNQFTDGLLGEEGYFEVLQDLWRRGVVTQDGLETLAMNLRILRHLDSARYERLLGLIQQDRDPVDTHIRPTRKIACQSPFVEGASSAADIGEPVPSEPVGTPLFDLFDED